MPPALPCPGPPEPPYAPLGRPGPRWAQGPPGPFGRRDKCLPVLAAKAEVGIEGASPKP